MAEGNGNLNAWARSLSDRLSEKIAHVNQIIEQRLEYQQKFLEQRLANVGEVNAEKLLGFSSRLEEALAEIRGYKDILQQQLTLLDNSVKKVHARVDEAVAGAKENQKDLAIFKEDIQKEIAALRQEFSHDVAEIRKEVEKQFGNLSELEGDLKKIQDLEREEEIVKNTRQNDPVRKFLAENGQKVLVFVLMGVGFFLLRNAEGLLKFFQSLAKGG